MKKSYNTIGSIGFVLMLTAVCGLVQAQTKTVTGKVTVGKGDQVLPLSGVSVSQVGSDQTTVTNSQGVYRLEISGGDESAVLIFRHPEYADQKVYTNGKATVNLAFNPKVKAIEEVVLNAGYYKVRDKERTGSISRIGVKDIENQPVTNVLAAAQGRMSGVSITQNSGTPGGGFDIQIRGRNSLRTRSNSEIDGNQPLYIVDGVPIGGGVNSRYAGSVLAQANINPLNSINPNDIESFEILKDADATAIYGSRGANGVVLITTKKAKKGNLRLTLNSSYGMSHAVSGLEMMNTEQYIGMRKQAYLNDNISTYPANAYDVNGTWDQGRMTDWRRELIGKKAVLSNTQLSLSGGSETTSYLLSLGHNQQTTVFGEDFRYRTNTVSGNIAHRSTDRKFSFNMSNLFSSLDNNVLTSDMTTTSYLLPPNAPALYDGNGQLNWENNTFNNPLAAYRNTYNNDQMQFLNNINASYEVVKNLTLKVNGGINYQAFEEWSLRPHTANNPSSGMTSAQSASSKSNQNRFSMIVEPQINYVFKVGNHQVDLLAGGTYQRDTNTSAAIQGLGFESNVFINNIGAAQTKIVSDDVTTEYRYAALFGRINYQYAGKYILNLTGRRDGSSRFGPNNKFATFGAVGAAWIFSKENFLKESPWLSFGKLRGSYGSSGSDNIGENQYLNTYITSTLIYNGVVGLLPSKLFNPDFSWEQTLKFETAVELGLFKNRLNLTAAYYDNRSSSQLLGYQLSAVTGFTSVLANLGATVQNKGWEFDVKGDLIRGDVFTWDAGFNISFPRNKLLSFPGLEGSSYANTYVVGQPVSIIKLYQHNGINPANGLYAFTDFNGDGKISSPDDRQVIRNIGQRFYGGLTNDFKYGNWNLSVLLQFVKQESRNYNTIMASPGQMNNLPVEALNVWSAENPTGMYMPYHVSPTASHQLFQVSDATVSDASFIRLKNVQLAYRVPLEGKIFREVKLYFQGQNLYTWTKYFGIDPEFSSVGFLPPLRTYSFGATLSL